MFDETDSTTYSERTSLNLNISHFTFSGSYCPITSDRVVQTIVLKGREGIWHLLSCKPHSMYEEIADEMDIELTEQPELQGFF